MAADQPQGCKTNNKNAAKQHTNQRGRKKNWQQTTTKSTRETAGDAPNQKN
jgi:hypothetical protein